MTVRADLIDQNGGLDELSTAQLLLIESITRNYYLLNEQDVRIFRMLKESPQAQGSPKVLATLYSYRAPIDRDLTDALKTLGLKKVPPRIRTLDEILSEDEESEQPEGGK